MKISELEWVFIETAATMEEYRREAKDMGFEEEERLYFVLRKFASALAENIGKVQ